MSSTESTGQIYRSSSCDLIVESESSNESSSLGGSSSDERLDIYHGNNYKYTSFRGMERAANVRDNVVIYGDNTVINLTPTVKLNIIGTSYTQVLHPVQQNITKQPFTTSQQPFTTSQQPFTTSQQPFTPQQQITKQPSKNVKPEKVMPDRAFLEPLYVSEKMLSDSELDLISKNLGCGWRDVGTRMLFKPAQLDQFQRDSSSHTNLCYRMLFRWRQWKAERATKGRLTKYLMLAEEFDALRVLEP
eukprot:TRINITY_DN30188_c0_g1_i6.p1 TRINITY_DN30188_c0_g1~~TRINITY_DN30188_c0_g1_i6.p1  ORF type:complete len:246 (-),score=48.68 TRINITY_DN30188_c0_g1_i6:316-1053(-)